MRTFKNTLTNLLLFVLLMFITNRAISQCDQYLFLVDNSGTVDATEFDLFADMINTSIDALGAACNAKIAIVNYGGVDGEEVAYVAPFGDAAATPDLTAADRIGNLGDDLNHAIGLINTELGLGAGGALASDPTCNTHLVVFTDAVGGAQCSASPFTTAESCILDGIGGAGMASAFAASPFVTSLVVRTDDSNGTELANYMVPAGNEIIITLDGTTDPNAVASSLVSTVSCAPIIKVPTLGEWTLIILGILLVIMAFVAISNRRSISIEHA